MNNYKQLSVSSLERINGGKITHYANGVYCNSKTGTCSVNWSEAWGSIGNNLVNSIGKSAGKFFGGR